MSQARVTDFFSQRKKGIAGPLKAATRSNTVVGRDSSKISTTNTRYSKKKDDGLCSLSVHEEFVRVIDEAVELNPGESATGKDPPCSPRTPKRTLSDAEFDLVAGVFSATANHSTAKKGRQVESFREVKANTPEKATKKTARKKLVLPQHTPQVT